MLSCVLYSGWRIVYLFVRHMFCDSRGKSVCILLIGSICHELGLCGCVVYKDTKGMTNHMIRGLF